MSARRRPAAVAAAVALAVAACGIPVGEPEALSQEGWEDVLEGTTTTVSTVVVDDEDSVEIDLFFVGEDRLERVTRIYQDSPQINDVLLELEEAPREDEQEAFPGDILLRTLVPVGLNATLLTETPADEARGIRVLTVNPEAGLRELLDTDPLRARLIVSQLVCTFLNLPSSDSVGVEIQDDLDTLDLTDNDSQVIDGPATVDDFGSCRTGTEELEDLVEEAETDADSSTTTDPTSTTTTLAGS